MAENVRKRHYENPIVLHSTDLMHTMLVQAPHARSQDLNAPSSVFDKLSTEVGG